MDQETIKIAIGALEMHIKDIGKFMRNNERWIASFESKLKKYESGEYPVYPEDEHRMYQNAKIRLEKKIQYKEKCLSALEDLKKELERVEV